MTHNNEKDAPERCPHDGQTLAWHLHTELDPRDNPRTNAAFLGCQWPAELDGPMASRYGRGWRLNPKPLDWLRSLRCLLTEHEWTGNPRKTQRVCCRCWTVQDLPIPSAEEQPR